jgi:hypothetical protein
MSSNFRFSIQAVLLVTAVVAFFLFAVPLVPPAITFAISMILVVFSIGLSIQVSLGWAAKKLRRWLGSPE